MNFLELAKNRYSERFFDPRPVEQEKLDKILESGRIVPTACNYQPQRGEFDPLTEKEMLEELKTFVENLTVDCIFNTHHTVAANLTGPNFLKRKDKIIATLDHVIQHGDMDRMAAYRRNKRTL